MARPTEHDDPSAHPEPRQLLDYERRPAMLGGNERESIAQHLKECRLCADELELLRSFDLDEALKRAKKQGPTGSR